MYKKIIFIAVILFNFFIPVLVNAEVSGANSQIPELNPFCWKKNDCIKVRRGFVTGNPTDEELVKDGFISNSSVAPCNTGSGADQWGRCLPAGVTKTEIDFGGRSSFSNIGDFILVMYKWLVTVASILSVIMIIVAGVQWITSGGNSESISSAKSRIGGAVIGLFIAYMSYFILNTINPNLVNFRLPQVWLVRPQNLIPEFCSDIPNYKNIKFAYVSGNGQEAVPSAGISAYLKKEDKDFLCGASFSAENGGTSKCLGSFCNKYEDQVHMCVSMAETGHPEVPGYGCIKGDLLIDLFADASIEDSLKASAGKVPLVGLFTDKALETGWLKEKQVVRAVCKLPDDGTLFLANSGTSVDLSDFGSMFLDKTRPGEIYTHYIHILSGLSDPNKIKEKFHCYVPNNKILGVQTGANVRGEVVGFFIRYEVAVNRVWADEYGPMLKRTAREAGAGAAAGVWFGGVGAIPGAIIGGSIGFIGGLIADDGPPQPNLNVGYNNGQAVYGLYASPELRKLQPAYENVVGIKSLDSYIPLDKLSALGGLRLKVFFTATDLTKIMVYRSSVPQNDNSEFWKTGVSSSTISP